MNNKYWFILGGIVLFAVAAGALVWSQSRQMSQQSGQAGTQAGESQTTTTTQNQGSGQLVLAVTQPANGATVSNPSVTVAGKTKVGADVSVNDKDTVADGSGNFSATLTLDEGDNPITVVANDADGNSVEQDLNVTYTVAE